MFSRIKHCRYLRIQRVNSNGYDHLKNNYFIHMSYQHMTNEKKEEIKYYEEYKEDCNILSSLRKNDFKHILNDDDKKDINKLKRKLLKLLKDYHPDMYIKEKNVERKKKKEEIFIEIYNKYKNIDRDFEQMGFSDIIDESIYEDEDDRNERIEKYKRYSEGKRKDIATKHIEMYIVISILLTFGLVFSICVYLPFKGSSYDLEHIYENVEERKDDNVVTCFYNPIMRRYEYLPQNRNYIPPNPRQLYNFYKNNFPELPIDEDILKLKHFEMIKLPKNRAKKCRLFYDVKTNELIFLKKKKKDFAAIS
ncbi:hypothetical protein PRSY57_0106400 [Plasmodium reichenowi]|uniref:J domain-containing protein n=1 Tax=Plasmodium reichenowi TaxID=5854 RepID=A0A151LW64_PLARE|nr:hypothetical protein PRSY57_0106400 [Plasmodium reichenowi]KYO03416.1 hypothetical protein PRSY57_0106400 [Plasmodium reichenowi]